MLVAVFAGKELLLLLINAPLLLFNFLEDPFEFFVSLIVFFEFFDFFGHSLSESKCFVHQFWIPRVEIMWIEKVVFLKWA